MDETTVSDLAVSDPFAAVTLDVAAVRAETRLGAGLRVSSPVYDVSTGTTETAVAP